MEEQKSTEVIESTVENEQNTKNVQSKQRIVYLADTENIGIGFLENLSTLDVQSDKLVLFQSNNTPKLTLKQSVRLAAYADLTTVVGVPNGTLNAMDFILVSELARLISINYGDMYIILSKDNGYNPVVNYWKNKGILVKKYDSLETANVALECSRKTKEENEKNLELNTDNVDNAIKSLDDTHEELMSALSGQVKKEINKELKQLSKSASNVEEKEQLIDKESEVAEQQEDEEYIIEETEIDVITQELDSKDITVGNMSIDEVYNNIIESYSTQGNIDIIKQVLKLRSDEDASTIANIISRNQTYPEAVKELNKALKYAKASKLLTIGTLWNKFFHVYRE